MFTSASSIGIIDSGIGGFSVARKVQELLPNENLIYLGDGANTPYGNHTADEILSMTRYMLQFMKKKQVKVLMIACNTISCMIDYYRDDIDCPIFSMIEAGAEAVKRQNLDKVAVISTCFTEKSKCYSNLIETLSPKTRVISCGCPDLAGVIEQYAGEPEHQNLIDDTLRKDLKGFLGADLDCILACTHYALVKENIHRIFPQLRLIDPADQMAQTLHTYLKERNLSRHSNTPGRFDIFTTGSLEEYIKKANRMGLKNITSVQFHPPMDTSNFPSKLRNW